MSTILIIILLILIFGGGGGYYARGRYGNAGLGGVLGVVLVILIVLWLLGGTRHLRTASVTCGAAGGIRDECVGPKPSGPLRFAAFLAGSKSSGNYSPRLPGARFQAEAWHGGDYRSC